MSLGSLPPKQPWTESQWRFLSLVTSLIDFLTHYYLEALEDLRLGFTKRPYFRQSNEVATRDEPSKNVAWKLVKYQTNGSPGWEGHRPHRSTVRNESPHHWIKKKEKKSESGKPRRKS